MFINHTPHPEQITIVGIVNFSSIMMTQFCRLNQCKSNSNALNFFLYNCYYLSFPGNVFYWHIESYFKYLKNKEKILHYLHKIWKFPPQCFRDYVLTSYSLLPILKLHFHSLKEDRKQTKNQQKNRQSIKCSGSSTNRTILILFSVISMPKKFSSKKSLIGKA